MSELENHLQAASDVLPEDTAATKTDMTPEEALALLRQGCVVQNARIRKLKLRGVFDKPVQFRNCTLIQLEMERAEFHELATFISCTLDRVAVRGATVFHKTWDISHSLVNKATFSGVVAKGQVLAAHTEFRGKLKFSDSTFEQRFSLWEAKFKCWADFAQCIYQGEADFRSIHCEEGIVFGNCTFNGDFLFRGSSVEKKFEADSSRFERLLDLSKAKLHDFCYLEGIEQGPLMRFAFHNAVAKRILIRPSQIEGRLASEESGNFNTAMHEYGLLKKCFQEQHRYDQEDWAFYRFKVNQRRSKGWSWKRPWSVWRNFADWLFLDIGCGYGTNPARAMRTAFFIIVAFAVLYGTHVEDFYAEKLPYDGEKTSLENRVMIGLITSVSVFTSGMGGIREIAKGWMNIPVMVESIMGTLLFGLFIVAFSRKVIR